MLTFPQLIIDQDGLPGSTVADLSGFQGLVGDSPAMLEVYTALLGMVDQSLVLVEGETGTGKELAARVLHGLGSQPHRPILALAGTDLPLDIYCSELERLSPTVTGGTLVLDELTELPVPHQEALLRFLEEVALSELRRGGSGRFVAIAREDLASRVEAGEILEPLVRRFAENRVVMPPLRERRDDLPLLVRYFQLVFSEQYGRSPLTLSDTVWSVFLEHSWDGNVRELRNEVESLVVLAPEDGYVDLSHLSPELQTTTDRKAAPPPSSKGFAGHRTSKETPRARGTESEVNESSEIEASNEALRCALGGSDQGFVVGVDPSASKRSRNPHHPGLRAQTQWRERTPALRPSLAPGEMMWSGRRRRGRY